MSKMVIVKLQLPDSVSDPAREEAEQQAQEAAVLALWKRQELTIREAADVCCLP
jgi:hypothetical protein